MVHTRATNSSLLSLDSEIERTLSRLRREARDHFRELPFDQGEEESEKMAANDDNRTLKELTTPNLAQQPLAIVFPELDEGVNFELKSGVVHLLPKFHGLSGEDPHKHLSELHTVVVGMKPGNVTEEQIKLRAFPFSLKDTANEWFYYLPPGSATT